MTPLDLDAIEARVNAAAAGDWQRDDTVIYVGSFDSGPIIAEAVWGAEILRGDAIATAEFLRAARTDVPALIAEVRRLRAVLGEIAEAGDISRWDDPGAVTEWARAALASGGRT